MPPRICHICSKPAEAIIPVGPVCREHAIEFYTILVREGARPIEYEEVEPMR